MAVELVIAQLVDALGGIVEMGWAESRRGHAPGCQEGYWISGCVPSPHSPRCTAANAALQHGREYLESVAVVQEALF